MKTILSKILNKISLSVIQGNKNSTPRVQSYIVLFFILIMIFSFGVFEYFNFMLSMKLVKPYVVSGETILMFGMILSHQLALVFSRKSSQSIEEIKGTKKDSPNDESLIDESLIDESSEEESK